MSLSMQQQQPSPGRRRLSTAPRMDRLPLISLPHHHSRGYPEELRRLTNHTQRHPEEDAAEAPDYGTGVNVTVSVRFVRPERFGRVVDQRSPADDDIGRYEDEFAEGFDFLAETQRFLRDVEVEATNISRLISAPTYPLAGGEGWASLPRRRALYPPATTPDADDESSTAATGHAEDESSTGSLDVLLGFSRDAMGVMIAEIKVLKDGWGSATQGAFVFAACAALASLGISVFTAGNSDNTMRRRISVFCARLSTLLFTILLIIMTSCQFGRTTCVAGGYIAGAAATGMTSLWAFGGLSSVASSISGFWRRLWDQQRNRSPPSRV